MTGDTLALSSEYKLCVRWMKAWVQVCQEKRQAMSSRKDGITNFKDRFNRQWHS